MTEPSEPRRGRANVVTAGLAGAGLAGLLGAVLFFGPSHDAGEEAATSAAPDASLAPAGASPSDPAALETRLSPPRSLSPPDSDRAVVAGAAGGYAPGPGAELQFVVQFDDAEGRRWLERFLDNPAEARAAFKDHARATPAFRNLRLVRVTPRGASTLAWDGAEPVSEEAMEALAREVVSRLNDAPGVDYAEPNLVAWRGSVEP